MPPPGGTYTERTIRLTRPVIPCSPRHPTESTARYHDAHRRAK
nr:MAG TPA: hypothetical protein [Caudoviricetes sp.]